MWPYRMGFGNKVVFIFFCNQFCYSFYLYIYIKGFVTPFNLLWHGHYGSMRLKNILACFFVDFYGGNLGLWCNEPLKAFCFQCLFVHYVLSSCCGYTDWVFD